MLQLPRLTDGALHTAIFVTAACPMGQLAGIIHKATKFICSVPRRKSCEVCGPRAPGKLDDAGRVGAFVRMRRKSDAYWVGRGNLLKEEVVETFEGLTE